MACSLTISFFKKAIVMRESLISVLLFWCAFSFSAGPFWTAIMASATTTSFTKIYKDYVLYLFTGWLALIIVIGILVDQIGGLGDNVVTALHLFGSIFIFYMAYKIYRSTPGKAGSFDFNWIKMCLLTWTNPKVWILIPIGFLGANFTSTLWINIALFYAIAIPIFLLCVYGWGMIGRLGAKVSLSHINKFNALLMVSFGLYLVYAGIRMLNMNVLNMSM